MSEAAVTGTGTGLIEPHGGSLVDRTGERPDDLESLETVTLTSREVSDLDMLASGALSPLEGFMGREDYERVVEDMHLANGLAWALPVCLAVQAAPEGDRVALADGDGRPLAVLEVEEALRVRQGARGRALLPHDRRSTSRSRPPLRPAPALPRRQRDRLRPARAPVPGARARSCGHAQGLRGARLAPSRRLPDPQSHPPGARVLDQGCPRDRRRPAHPPARRRDEVRRRAGRNARRVLPRPRRQLLPGRPRDRVRVPGRDALRGPARGDLARDLPQELRLLALHRRARPRGRRRLLRHVRRAAHLRRVRAARARHRADVLRARVLVQRLRLDGDAEDVSARRRRPRVPVRDEGPRAARGRGAAAASSSPAPRSPRF